MEQQIRVLILNETGIYLPYLLTGLKKMGAQVTVVESAVEFLEQLAKKDYALLVVGLVVLWWPRVPEARERAVAVGLEDLPELWAPGLRLLEILQERGLVPKTVVLSTSLYLIGRDLPDLHFPEDHVCDSVGDMEKRQRFFERHLTKRS